MYPSHMRTTLNIEDNLYQAAKSIAEAEGKSLGRVISALLRKALMSHEYGESSDDLPVFRVSENAPPLTPVMVRDAEEDTR
jgi:hypothetical protein